MVSRYCRMLAAGCLSALLALLPTLAHAGFTVHMPTVVKGEREVEISLSQSRDSDKLKDGAGNYTIALGYGLTDWLALELEGEWEKAPNGGSTKFEEYELESTFQFTEQGKYWFNAGLFASYGHPTEDAEPPKVTLAPIFQVELSRSVHTVNLIFSKALKKASGESAEEEAAEHGLTPEQAEALEGRNTTNTQFGYAWQSRFRMTDTLDAGFEIFANTGDAGKPLPQDQQDIRVGPVLYGSYKPTSHTKLLYEVGYLVGATKATPDGTVKLNVEFEF